VPDDFVIKLARGKLGKAVFFEGKELATAELRTAGVESDSPRLYFRAWRVAP
jgi:hypothetical protein